MEPLWYSILWVIGLILLLTVILDRLVFRPILNVIKQREDAVSSARALAETAALEARQASEEFDRKTQEARAGIYKQMDEMRREALAERTALIDDTRREVEGSLTEAKARLAAEVESARTTLEAEAGALAADAAQQILGRRAS